MSKKVKIILWCIILLFLIAGSGIGFYLKFHKPKLIELKCRFIEPRTREMIIQSIYNNPDRYPFLPSKTRSKERLKEVTFYVDHVLMSKKGRNISDIDFQMVSSGVDYEWECEAKNNEIASSVKICRADLEFSYKDDSSFVKLSLDGIGALNKQSMLDAYYVHYMGDYASSRFHLNNLPDFPAEPFVVGELFFQKWGNAQFGYQISEKVIIKDFWHIAEPVVSPASPHGFPVKIKIVKLEKRKYSQSEVIVEVDFGIKVKEAKASIEGKEFYYGFVGCSNKHKLNLYLNSDFTKNVELQIDFVPWILLGKEYVEIKGSSGKDGDKQ